MAKLIYAHTCYAPKKEDKADEKSEVQMSEEEKAAEEYAEGALVSHWGRRVKAEQENTAPFGQITTVKDCYVHGFLAAIEWERKRRGKTEVALTETAREIYREVDKHEQQVGQDITITYGKITDEEPSK